MKKYNLEINTMNESDLQRVYIYNTYPRESKLYSDKRFVNMENASQRGSHWTCFIVKVDKPYYYDSFRRAPDNFLLEQILKSITNHNYKWMM